jgi:hypothetical protein
MQELIVALIVGLALVYTVWRFLPARWRRRLVRRAGLPERVASAGACHSCDDCAGADACKPTAKTP